MSLFSSATLLSELNIPAKAQAVRMLTNTGYMLYMPPEVRATNPDLVFDWLKVLRKYTEAKGLYWENTAELSVKMLLDAHPGGHVYIGWLDHSVDEEVSVESMSDEKLLTYVPDPEDSAYEWSDRSPNMDSLVLQVTQHAAPTDNYSNHMQPDKYIDNQKEREVPVLGTQVLVLPIDKNMMRAI